MEDLYYQDPMPDDDTVPEGTDLDSMTLGYLALLGFVFSTIFNPARIFPVLSILHLQDVFAIIAILWFFAKVFISSQKIVFSRIELTYFLFILATALGFINLNQYGIADNGLSLYQNSLKALIVLIMLSIYPSTFVLFRKGFFFFLLAIALFQLHGFKAILAGAGLHAGRFVSHVGLINNSDAVGAFLVMILPIQLELHLYFKSRIKKYTMLALSLISIMLIVLTQTRSAFLSLIVVLPLWVFKRRKRGGWFIVASLLIASLVVVGTYMSTTTDYENYFSRMKSIFSSEKYLEDSNVRSRFVFWRQGLEIWTMFPVIGCGIGGMDPHETVTQSDEGLGFTEGQSLSRYSLHQTFIQIMAERGSIGFLLFMLFLFFLFLSIRRTNRYLEKFDSDGYFLSVSNGLGLSLVAYFINAQFMTIAESWMLIVPAGFAAALYKVVRRLEKDEEYEPEEEEGPYEINGYEL